MLPSFAKLDARKLKYCPPVGAVLPTWEDRMDLPMDKQNRLPESYNDSRTECSICQEPLNKDDDGEESGDLRVLAIVDFEGSCGHSYHVSCLSKWFDERQPYQQTLTCMVCNQPVLDEWVDATYNRIMGARPAIPDARPSTRRREAAPQVDPDRPPRVIHYRVLRPGDPIPERRLAMMPTWRQILMLTIAELQRMRAEMARDFNQLRQEFYDGLVANRVRGRDIRNARRDGYSWMQIIDALANANPDMGPPENRR